MTGKLHASGGETITAGGKTLVARGLVVVPLRQVARPLWQGCVWLYIFCARDHRGRWQGLGFSLAVAQFLCFGTFSETWRAMLLVVKGKNRSSIDIVNM